MRGRPLSPFHDLFLAESTKESSAARRASRGRCSSSSRFANGGSRPSLRMMSTASGLAPCRHKHASSNCCTCLG
eukprot:4650220-Pyramimonas_sp.AAC.1